MNAMETAGHPITAAAVAASRRRVHLARLRRRHPRTPRRRPPPPAPAQDHSPAAHRHPHRRPAASPPPACAPTSPLARHEIHRLRTDHDKLRGRLRLQLGAEIEQPDRAELIARVAALESSTRQYLAERDARATEADTAQRRIANSKTTSPPPEKASDESSGTPTGDDQQLPDRALGPRRSPQVPHVPHVPRHRKCLPTRQYPGSRGDNATRNATPTPEYRSTCSGSSWITSPWPPPWATTESASNANNKRSAPSDRWPPTPTGNPAPFTSPTAYQRASVAVPFGNCTEPSNVTAGGGACPIRFQCAGCGFYRPDPSYLPALEQHVADLRADRETARAIGAADYVLANLTAEIDAFARVVEQMQHRLADLASDQRAEVEQASRLLRRARAGRRLPLTVNPPPAQTG